MIKSTPAPVAAPTPVHEESSSSSSDDNQSEGDGALLLDAREWPPSEPAGPARRFSFVVALPAKVRDTVFRRPVKESRAPQSLLKKKTKDRSGTADTTRLSSASSTPREAALECLKHHDQQQQKHDSNDDDDNDFNHYANDKNMETNRDETCTDVDQSRRCGGKDGSVAWTKVEERKLWTEVEERNLQLHRCPTYNYPLPPLSALVGAKIPKISLSLTFIFFSSTYLYYLSPIAALFSARYYLSKGLK